MLGAPVDGEDITDKILEELGVEYKELVCAVQARDTSIAFDELHEKLLMFEAFLNTSHKASLQFSPTANAAVNRYGYRSKTFFGRINWHFLLGHPSLPILNVILSKNKLNTCSMTKQFSCNACQCNKSHKLPFSASTLESHAPLEIIFSDEWTVPM